MVLWYFTFDDVIYNPFEKYHFKHTRISVKSLLLGSFSNMTLFAAKPLLADVMRWVWKIWCQESKFKDNDSDSNEKQGFERLVSVYKRPKVKWQNEDSSHNYIMNH